MAELQPEHEARGAVRDAPEGARQDIDPRLAELSSALVKAQGELADAQRRADDAIRSALAWRARAIGAWADRTTSGPSMKADELEFLRNQTHFLTSEMDAMKGTLSWRVTKPIRIARSMLNRISR